MPKAVFLFKKSTICSTKMPNEGLVKRLTGVENAKSKYSVKIKFLFAQNRNFQNELVEWTT